jgi:hypothetical protein
MPISPFPSPLIFVAWGLMSGTPGDRFGDASALRDWAKSTGFKTVCLQTGQCTPADVKTLQDGGIFVVLWNVMDASIVQIVRDFKPNGIMPQIEGPGQYDSCVQALEALKAAGNTLPLAVVTTYWGLYDPTNDTTIRSGSKWKKIASLGVKAAFVECYKADADSHANLDQMLGQGEIYGIPKDALISLCGTYRGEMPSAYAGLDKQGRIFGVYLAEPMTGDQWVAWGKVNPEQPPPPPPPPSPKVGWWQVKVGTQVLFEQRAVTFSTSPLDTGLTRCIDWLDSHLDTVRAAKTITLTRVLK